MRLSRHARNKLRHSRVTAGEIGQIARQGTVIGFDRRGNPRVAGEAMDGRSFVVVLAVDDLDYVITLWRIDES